MYQRGQHSVRFKIYTSLTLLLAPVIPAVIPTIIPTRHPRHPSIGCLVWCYDLTNINIIIGSYAVGRYNKSKVSKPISNTRTHPLHCGLVAQRCIHTTVPYQTNRELGCHTYVDNAVQSTQLAPCSPHWYAQKRRAIWEHRLLANGLPYCVKFSSPKDLV